MFDDHGVQDSSTTVVMTPIPAVDHVSLVSDDGLCEGSNDEPLTTFDSAPSKPSGVYDELTVG